MEVENTYAGDDFLVTVADYDAEFVNYPAYEDYGKVYRNLEQVYNLHLMLHVPLPDFTGRVCCRRVYPSFTGSFRVALTYCC